MNHLISFTEAVAEERSKRRSLNGSVLHWGQQGGKTVDPDLLALVPPGSARLGSGGTGSAVDPSVHLRTAAVPRAELVQPQQMSLYSTPSIRTGNQDAAPSPF